MSWENPPAIIEQLRTQLLACDSWEGGADNVHYPYAEGLVDEEAPLAVLEDLGRTGEPYAAGADALPGGTLQIVIRSPGSIGEVEALGRTILDELLAQQTGIPFRGGETGVASKPSPAKKAGGADIRTIALTLTWGLSP